MGVDRTRRSKVIAEAGSEHDPMEMTPMSCIPNDSIDVGASPLGTIFPRLNPDLAILRTRHHMGTTAMAPTAPGEARLSVLGGGDREFSEAIDAIRGELAPRGPVESILVDRVVLALERLHRAIAPGSRGRASAIAAAERSLDRALAALDARRAAVAETSSWGRPAAVSTRLDDESALPPLPTGDLVASEPFDTESAVEAEPVVGHWRTRLTFDENVSDHSPVVRGTWVTAGQVVSLVVDGWTWDEILRHYPELTEQDIRACLAYTVDQDGPQVF